MALIFKGRFKGEETTQIVASTGSFLRNEDVRFEVLSRIVNSMALSHKWTDSFKVGEASYHILLNEIEPEIWSVILIPSKDVIGSKFRLIGGATFILIVVNLLILMIYVSLVKDITGSVDGLISIAQKASKGDLSQRVQVTTTDEIGVLSQIFNQMMSSLKETTEVLIREKEKAEVIISQIPDGIMVTDAKNRLILANKKAEEMFKFSASQSYGKFIMTIIENQEMVDMLNDHLKSSKQTSRREIKIQIDGEEKVYRFTSGKVTHNLDPTLGVIVVARNITHEKELEVLRESFLRTVSHELRTPLTSIMGFVDILHRESAGKLTDKQKEYLKIALVNAEHLRGLISDLLDLSRIEAGKIKLIYESFNVEELLDTVISSMTPFIQDKQLDLVLKIKDKTLEMEADKEKIRRILLNIISNAVKFTIKGSITVSCYVDGDNVKFSVADTGIGIMDHEKDIIFDKFRQIDASTTRQYDGIGLGLSIVKNLVELHKGQLKIESVYHEGSTFTFWIPKSTRKS
ncbi:MAG: PAS domain-containing protein [Candidatus Margulisbacteria bacterium]|nr:PAS domain-containing protein [Candidatus Margulisiibacteriota bacterium]